MDKEYYFYDQNDPEREKKFLEREDPDAPFCMKNPNGSWTVIMQPNWQVNLNPKKQVEDEKS